MTLLKSYDKANGKKFVKML